MRGKRGGRGERERERERGKEQLLILLHNFRLARVPGKLQTLNFSSYENLSIGLQASRVPKSCEENCLCVPAKFTWRRSTGPRRPVVFARSGIRNFSWPRETSFILPSQLLLLLLLLVFFSFLFFFFFLSFFDLRFLAPETKGLEILFLVEDPSFDRGDAVRSWSTTDRRRRFRNVLAERRFKQRVSFSGSTNFPSSLRKSILSVPWEEVELRLWRELRLKTLKFYETYRATMATGLFVEKYEKNRSSSSTESAFNFWRISILINKLLPWKTSIFLLSINFFPPSKEINV